MALSSWRGGDAPPAVTSDPCGDVVSDVNSFQCGDTVVSVRDLRVRGSVVVRQAGRGCVVGPASSSGRICVQFEQREDLSDNRLNCLPDELRHALVGGHQVGTRVRAARPLEASRGRSVAPGMPGIIVGPARELHPPHRRLLVRFALNGDEAVEEIACDPDDVETAIAGNFRRGNAVIATRDLRVGGAIVVREGVLGSVIGPSSSDSQHRVTVSFSHREDGSRNRLNCVVNEIRLYLAGGLEVGARVQVTRTVSLGSGGPPVPGGTRGTVVGPAADEPLVKVVVRLDNVPPNFGPAERELRSDDLALVIAGGFRRGESVSAAKDLRVKGVVVVKQGVVGTVVGQSATDPGGRVTVAFARREDGRCNNLNVVPAEIQRTPCTGGLVPGDRVAALRQLLVVPRGAYGSVLGPSCARSSRVAVRFQPADETEEVVLHVEPEDLRSLHAVGEDVDDDGPEMPDGGDEMTEDTVRATVAGGYDRGDTVAATRDLCVRGKVVVRANVLGTVIGPSGDDPTGRVTVAFAWREDGKSNNLNVVTSEIRKVEPRAVARGELCAICLGELVEDEDTTTGSAPSTAPEEAAVGGQDICRMPCGHVLHAGCIRAYLNHQTASTRLSPSASTNSTSALAPLKPAQCPVCRRDVLP
mmetsp:Transcript_79371/g.199389  ORF Transcript_79371/g.199389 Transcript_79371/m.199389 type:complete len:642 (+) Transcript_79371:68-1993(+)